MGSSDENRVPHLEVILAANNFRGEGRTLFGGTAACKYRELEMLPA